MSKISCAVFFLLLPIIFTGLIPNNIAFCQTEQEYISSESTIQITKVGLELIQSSIVSGDLKTAEKSSEFTSDFFGKQVQVLRAVDSQTSDEIHVMLLDLHANILSQGDANQIKSEIETVNKLLDKIQNPDVKNEFVISNILSIADENYQVGIQENDEASYQIAKSLVYSSKDLFVISPNNFDQRLRLELDSFFQDLINQVEQKTDFVIVGTVITAIQRDLMGTETVVLDQQNLYNVIRDLYEQLLVALDSNDYVRAEELATEAYLENFEYLEADIEIVDASLLYTLEINMREELRNMIKNHEDSQKISTFLEKSILPDLEKAEDLVYQHKSSSPTSIGIEASAISDRDLKEIGDATEDEKSGVRNEIDFIRDSLESVMIYYQNGDYQAAYTAARTAYLDSYEFVEIPLRSIDPDFTLEVEFQFADLRNLIKEQAPFEDVQQAAVKIKRSLDESERLVTGTGAIAPAIAFSSSFSIIFREGLESVLILGAILSYLEASRNTKFKPYVYYGVILAIAATAVTWFIASYVIEISGANRELIEAVAALSATAVLFYVSFWILNKIETKKWIEFVKAKIWQATTTGGVMVFVMLSFFTVYREGFETVLFYQAMSSFAKYMEVYVSLGFVLGIISLLVVYYGMRRLGRKLPLRALFALTMGIGAYLSLAFLGNAIRELQTLDVISYTSLLGIMPRLDINLATMTGIYPTLETIIGQIILLGVYLSASFYVLFLRPRKEKQITAMRKSRGDINVHEKTH
ncbi:MAG: FTR1 family iron permease [Nitrosopumilaceae archaeon]